MDVEHFSLGYGIEVSVSIFRVLVFLFRSSAKVYKYLFQHQKLTQNIKF